MTRTTAWRGTYVDQPSLRARVLRRQRHRSVGDRHRARADAAPTSTGGSSRSSTRPGPRAVVARRALPPDLARRYGADLAIALRADRPTIVSNFVSTIDGVVAFDTEGRTGGREVSGASEPDRFLMGLLRATADAVLDRRRHRPLRATIAGRPAYIYPPSAEAYAAWRRAARARRPQPTTVIVSASGSIDPGHPGLHDPGVPVVIVTTDARCQPTAGRGSAGHGRGRRGRIR